MIRKPTFTNRNGEQQETKNFHCFFVDHQGIRRRIALGPDEESARHADWCINHLVECKRTKMPPNETALSFLRHAAPEIKAPLISWLEMTEEVGTTLSIGTHLAAYESALLADGCTKKHCTMVASRLGSVLPMGVRFNDAGAEAEMVRSQVADRVVSGSISKTTANKYIAAAKAFGRWLLASGRLKFDPFTTLTPMKRAGKTRLRRALCEQELHAFDKLELRPSRKLVYNVALHTGFRANELRAIRVQDVDLDNCVISLNGGFTKNGVDAMQPIPDWLASDIREAIRAWDLKPTEPLLDVPCRPAEALRHDLREILDDSLPGSVDFHSLRVTYVTQLIKSGLSPAYVQKLARHSTITLTLDLYTQLGKTEHIEAYHKIA